MVRLLTNDDVRLSCKRPIRAEPYRGTAGVAAHEHSFLEIGIVTAGAMTHCGYGKAELLETGAVIVVPRGAHHELAPVGGGAEVINVFVLDSYVAADLGNMRRELGVARLLCDSPTFFALRPAAFTIQPEGRDFTLMVEEARLLIDEGQRATPSPLLMRSALLKLFVLAGRSRGNVPEPHAPDARPEVWALLTEIEAAVIEARAFDAAAVAGRTGLSRERLSRLFRKHTGSTPSAHFQRRRAHAAGRRLVDETATVTEIAHDLGYADTAHLSRLFKRVMGVTPLDYRRSAGRPCSPPPCASD